VDFSRTSNKAYFYAKKLARSVGAEIHVVHVLDTHYLTGALHIIIEPRDKMVQKWKEHCQEKLNMFYRKREENGFAVQLHMREGKPHEEILKAAEELEADIIVIGSHGWSGLERYIFGNIARRVLKISDIPVLVIKLKGKSHRASHSG
jgi:nucleotide-binding universal stress UspA family protein